MLKEPKVYRWDWSVVEDFGQRAENFIAMHLLKTVNVWTDRGFGKYKLHFVRDKEKQEVDFLATKNDKPWFLVEAKYSAGNSISSSLYRFQKQLQAPHAFQVVVDEEFACINCFSYFEPISVPAKTFLSQLQ